MDLISVIVPVYKVEPYLDRCVQSIVDQTYQNLEIILVDDGSPDNCGAICDAWAVKDSRIRVIHQQNAGSGAARNAALDVANGEVIAFVDSDDYIASDMFSHLYGLLIQGADIAECSHKNVWDDQAVFSSADSAVHAYTVHEAMAEHIRDRFFRQLIWNKLYRRELIGEIRFPAGKKIDDEFFTYRVLGNAAKLIRSEKICYAYRQQHGSIMHQSFSLHRLQAVHAKCQRLELVKERFPELLSIARINLWGTCLFWGQMSLLHLDKADRMSALNELQAVCAKYPLTSEDKKSMSLKQYIWAALSNISFIAVCKLRNLLKRGL